MTVGMESAHSFAIQSRLGVRAASNGSQRYLRTTVKLALIVHPLPPPPLS
jgi:hypothetical protein